jgi:hypothetical protein
VHHVCTSRWRLIDQINRPGAAVGRQTDGAPDLQADDPLEKELKTKPDTMPGPIGAAFQSCG